MTGKLWSGHVSIDVVEVDGSTTPSALRVLHVINQLRGYGGAEVSLGELLRRTEGDGFHHGVVLLRALGNRTEAIERVGVEVITPPRKLNLVQGVLAVRSAIGSFRPDVVHATLFDAGCAGRLAARSCRVPAILSLVNTPYEPEARTASGAAAWKVWGVKRLDRALVGSTVRFHALSEAVAQSYMRSLHIPREKIEIIPRGKDEVALGRRSDARRSRARSSLGIKDTDVVLLAIGREEPQKGHVDLLEALAVLRPSLPDLRLVMAGRPGSASGATTEAARRLGLEDIVTRLGPRPDVPDLLCAGDVFVFPSLFEGLGVSVLEAMAMEIPIVASDVPALRDLLDNGALAVLVPPSDPHALAEGIRSALAEGTRSNRAIAARQRFEERYRLEPVAERMKSLWQRSAAAPREALFVITDPGRRGAQVSASELASSLRGQGWRVRLVSLAGGISGDLGAEVLGTRKRSFLTARRLRRHIRDASVVVGFGSTTLPMCALAGLGLSTPFIYRTIGELDVWAPSGLRRARTRLALGRTVAVVALWQAARDVVIERFGVPQEQVFVIPTGVQVRPLPSPAERHRARAAIMVPEDAPVALYLGALSEEKRPFLAVEAVACVAAMHLIVAGDGPLRPMTEALAERRAPGRVHFLGQVTDTTEVFRAADVLLLTSRTEGLPAVVLEAAAAGVPAVATSVGAVSELVRHGRTGAVVPVDAAPAVIAVQLSAAIGQGRTMGARARAECFPRYELSAVTVQWSDLLGEVIDRSR